MLQFNKEVLKDITRNRLYLETLGSPPIMPQNLREHRAHALSTSPPFPLRKGACSQDLRFTTLIQLFFLLGQQYLSGMWFCVAQNMITILSYYRQHNWGEEGLYDRLSE